MKMVLDTTEIVRDPLLSTIQTQTLREFARLSGAEIVVPEVVLREAMRRMNADLRTAANSVQEAMHDAGKWLGAVTFVSGVGKWLDDGRRWTYVERLRFRLEERGIRILDYPDVPHAHLVEAVCARQPPFGQKGQGYQDALVWCTVLGLAKGDNEVALITQNRKDFPASEDGTPDPGLLTWPGDIGGPSVGLRTRIYHSVDEFSTAVISPAYPKLSETVQIMAGKHPGIDVRAAIAANATDIVRFAVETSGFLTLDPPIPEEARLDLNDLRVDIRDVRSVSDREVEVEATCAFYIDLSRIATFGQVFDRWTASSRPWSADALSVSAEVSATFNRESGAVTSFEIGTVAHGEEGR